MSIKASKTKNIKLKSSSAVVVKKKKASLKKEIKDVVKKPIKKLAKPEKKKEKSTEVNVRLIEPQKTVKTEKEIVEETITAYGGVQPTVGRSGSDIKKEEPVLIKSAPRVIDNHGNTATKEEPRYQFHPAIIQAKNNIIAEEPIDSKLVEEITNKEFQHEDFVEDAPAAKPVSLGLYRKIAYGFIFFTVILLATIFYLSFVKVSITITPKQESVGDTLLVDVYDSEAEAPVASGAVKGVVAAIEVEQTKKYSASGIEIIGEEAVGKAMIINNYNKSQSLVAATRLLTSDNKLFRIKNTINVPAGQSVEVDIYADDPGPKMAIGPTKFKIPGLWAGLQDKIYAESKEAVEYKQKIKKYVTQSDIDNGVVDLKSELSVKAKNDMDMNYKNYDHAVYDIDNNSIDVKVEAKVNDEKEDFAITIKTSVAVVAFKDDQIFTMAKEKLVSRISDDKELSGFNKDNIVYSLNNYDISSKTATVNASFEGLMTYKSDSNIIDKSMLPGLDRTQLVEFLDSKTELEDYEIKFYPSFINKVPNLVDRIEINIKKSSVSGG